MEHEKQGYLGNVGQGIGRKQLKRFEKLNVYVMIAEASQRLLAERVQ